MRGTTTSWALAVGISHGATVSLAPKGLYTCDGVGAGMMALIALSDEKVEKICADQREVGKKVWAANYNTDGQIVLAGSKSDLESLVDTFKEAGAKRAIVLDMSVASHCPILKSAIAKLSPMLNNMLKDNFIAPVISNATTF